MKRRGHDKNEEAKRSERKAMLGLACVVTAFVVILGASLVSKQTRIDTSDHCPSGPENQAPRSTMVLIDLTDPVTPMKRGAIHNATQEIVSTLLRHERFSLFVLRPNEGKAFIPVFTGCNPGEPGVGDYLAKGRRQIKNEFEKAFTAAMESALSRELASLESSQKSPILASIRDLVQSQYRRPSNRLFLFSDLLEHSDITSLYRREQTFDAVLRSPANHIIESIDLNGTSVVVCPTDHPAAKVSLAAQANAIKFFNKFFAHANAACAKMSCQEMAQACK